MSRQLIIIRHAKSDWDQPLNDFDRPLNKRGREATVLVGQYLQNQGICPDIICSSTATRAAETIQAICPYIGFDSSAISWNPDLYLASLQTICNELAAIPVTYKQVMLIGHNPGLEQLVQYLAKPGQIAKAGKVFPTAAIGYFDMPEDWGRLSAGCGSLISIVKPRELKP